MTENDVFEMQLKFTFSLKAALIAFDHLGADKLINKLKIKL